MPVVMSFLCVLQAQARQLCRCWQCQGPRAEPGDGAGEEEEGGEQKHKSQPQPQGHGRQEAQQGHDPFVSSPGAEAAPSPGPCPGGASVSSAFPSLRGWMLCAVPGTGAHPELHSLGECCPFLGRSCPDCVCQRLQPIHGTGCSSHSCPFVLFIIAEFYFHTGFSRPPCPPWSGQLRWKCLILNLS